MFKTKIKTKHKIALKDGEVKTYAFKVVVEPDEDRWFAYCPTLERKGAATWGYTKKEALKNIQEVAQMVVESMIERKEVIPEDLEDGVKVFYEPLVAVTVDL